MSSSIDDSVKEQLMNEAQKRAEISLVLCVGHLATASMYGAFNFWVGMFNTALAATAGVSALSKFDPSGVVTGVLSVLVAALTALLTFLSPSDRNKFHWNAANEFEQLSVKFSRFVDVVSKTETSNQALEELLDELLDKYFQTTKTYPIPAWAIGAAMKNMRKSSIFEKMVGEKWIKKL